MKIGVRDILGKEDVQQIGAALSDLAETCLERIARSEYEKLVEKLGEPTVEEGPRAENRAGRALGTRQTRGSRANLSQRSRSRVSLRSRGADGHSSSAPAASRRAISSSSANSVSGSSRPLRSWGPTALVRSRPAASSHRQERTAGDEFDRIEKYYSAEGSAGCGSDNRSAAHASSSATNG